MHDPDTLYSLPIRSLARIQHTHTRTLTHIHTHTGHMGDLDGMKKHINDAVGMLDGLDRSTVSRHSLASAYHRLATSYMANVSVRK
jgi:hypothetical protein